MFFVAVLYSLLTQLLPTALQPKYLPTTRSKYGDLTFLTIRKVKNLSIKLQKRKYDLEFTRICIIYQLTPTFVKITLRKKKIKTTSEYRLFQQSCLQEYKNRFKDSVKYEKN